MNFGSPQTSRFLAVVTASLMLSACWESETTLITPAASVNPIPAGSYAYYSRGNGEPVDIQLIPFPGGGYVYYNKEEDNALPMLVYQFDDDWHILQLGNDKGTLIALTRQVEDIIEVYDPDCNENLDHIKGLERNVQNCSFDSLEALIEASKLTAQRIEAGEHSEIHGRFWPGRARPID